MLWLLWLQGVGIHSIEGGNQHAHAHAHAHAHNRSQGVGVHSTEEKKLTRQHSRKKQQNDASFLVIYSKSISFFVPLQIRPSVSQK